MYIYKILYYEYIEMYIAVILLAIAGVANVTTL